MTDKAPTRWLRFSLRSLFVLVLVVAAYFAGWRSASWTAEREKEEAVRKAVEELQAAREKGEYEDGAPLPVGGGIGKVEVYTIPEIDVIRIGSPVPTEPPKSTKQNERYQRFLEMQKLFGKAPGTGNGTVGDVDESPPPRTPQEQP